MSILGSFNSLSARGLGWGSGGKGPESIVVDVYSNPGTVNWIVPTNFSRYSRIFIVGGGGSGGSPVWSNPSPGAGSGLFLAVGDGGSAGQATLITNRPPDTPGTSIQIVTGSPGGFSKFGTTTAAAGASGGVRSTTGPLNLSGVQYPLGGTGTGGSGTSGNGGPGSSITFNSVFYAYGYGGGGGSLVSPAGSGNTFGGNGGLRVYSSTPSTSGSANGTSAIGVGSGGGGSAIYVNRPVVDPVVAANGGSGGKGLVIVEYYIYL